MFDPKKYLINVQGGRKYLPVSARLIWFREQHTDWGIETRPVVIDTDKQFAIFEAKVFNADGKLMSTGTKMEDVRGFPDYVEKSETGAIGRALAVCGFGTQFAPELDEVTNGRFVDSPQPSRQSDALQATQSRPSQPVDAVRDAPADEGKLKLLNDIARLCKTAFPDDDEAHIERDKWFKTKFTVSDVKTLKDKPIAMLSTVLNQLQTVINNQPKITPLAEADDPFAPENDQSKLITVPVTPGNPVESGAWK